jgi:hypothetical protein
VSGYHTSWKNYRRDGRGFASRGSSSLTQINRLGHRSSRHRLGALSEAVRNPVNSMIGRAGRGREPRASATTRACVQGISTHDSTHVRSGNFRLRKSKPSTTNSSTRSCRHARFATPTRPRLTGSPDIRAGHGDRLSGGLPSGAGVFLSGSLPSRSRIESGELGTVD